MKKIIKKIRQNKLLFILTIITIISILMGILFPALLGKSDTTLIKDTITNYITNIKGNKLNIPITLVSTTTNNVLVTVFLWLLGISLIGIPIIILIIFFHGFLTGFSLSSILVTYKLKGLLLAIIYTIPNILQLITSFLLSYYAISISLAIYKNILKKENISWKIIIKRYIKLGLFFLVSSIVIAIIEVIIIPKIITFL